MANGQTACRSRRGCHGFYKILMPGDLDALVAYVQTVEPVRGEVSPPVYKAEAHSVAILGGETSIGSDVPADPVKRGFYLATLAHPTLAHCVECHPRKPDGTPDFVNSWGKGGHEKKGPFGSGVQHLVAHEKGVGVWSGDELRQAAPSSSPWRGTSIQQDDRSGHQRHHRWMRTIPPVE